jgi:ferrous iron transport protein A
LWAVFTTANFRPKPHSMIRSVPHTQATQAEEGTDGLPDSVSLRNLERLAQSRHEASVVIEGVEAAPALRRRLLEAGFTAGSPVRFLMATPFGDPLVFSLRGASIALRKSEARCVRVRL